MNILFYIESFEREGHINRTSVAGSQFTSRNDEEQIHCQIKHALQ